MASLVVVHGNGLCGGQDLGPVAQSTATHQCRRTVGLVMQTAQNVDYLIGNFNLIRGAGDFGQGAVYIEKIAPFGVRLRGFAALDHGGASI